MPPHLSGLDGKVRCQHSKIRFNQSSRKGFLFDCMIDLSLLSTLTGKGIAVHLQSMSVFLLMLMRLAPRELSRESGLKDEIGVTRFREVVLKIALKAP